MKNKIFYIVLLCISLIACKKEHKPDVFKVTNIAATTTHSEAQIEGTYSYSNDPQAMNIVYGITKDMADAQSKALTIDGKDNKFNVDLDSLKSGFKYYYYIECVASISSAKSDIYTFSTLGPELPIVETSAVNSIAQNTATYIGYVTSTGGEELIERGFCWGTGKMPTIENDTIIDENIGEGMFLIDITGLRDSTKYYVRAFATNSLGTSYGDTISFVTLANPEKPKVTTKEVSSVTENSAICGGEVIDEGKSTVTARGICWGTSTNPVIENDKHTTLAGGTGEFTSTMTDLASGTKYYVRAYATNNVGTSYGDTISFVTTALPPTVISYPITDITNESANIGGYIIDNGGAVIKARGVCWSTSPEPTLNDSILVDTINTDIGEFSYSISGLENVTTYYARIFASNAVETGFGEIVCFTTLAGKPDISTDTVIDINETTASVKGYVIDNGGAEIIEKGFCWSQSENPTISNSSTSEVSNGANGLFTAGISELAPYKQYYIRAYATNETGTSYGEQISFTTLSFPPKLDSIVEISSITNESAVCNSVVIDNGGAEVTGRGFCWSESENPTIENASVADAGTGSGSFTATLSGLNHSTTYYVRAFATNIRSTVYSEQYSFTTEGELPIVTTDENIAEITQTTAIFKGIIVDNGGCDITRQGFLYSTSTNPQIGGTPIDGTLDGDNTFTVQVTDLLPNTTYYVVAYAENDKGIGFGEIVSFTTLEEEQGNENDDENGDENNDENGNENEGE